MSEEKNDKKKNATQSAEEVAKIMVANMAANMADPDFLDRQERIRSKAAKKVIAARKLREQKQKEEAEKGQSAKEVAEAMVANMAANMADPDFLEKQDLLRDKVRRKVVEARRLRKLKEQQEAEK